MSGASTPSELHRNGLGYFCLHVPKIIIKKGIHVIRHEQVFLIRSLEDNKKQQFPKIIYNVSKRMEHLLRANSEEKPV